LCGNPSTNLRIDPLRADVPVSIFPMSEARAADKHTQFERTEAMTDTIYTAITANQFAINPPVITMPRLATADSAKVAAFAERTVATINRLVTDMNRGYTGEWSTTQPPLETIRNAQNQAALLINVLDELGVIDFNEWKEMHHDVRTAADDCRTRKNRRAAEAAEKRESLLAAKRAV